MPDVLLSTADLTVVLVRSASAAGLEWRPLQVLAQQGEIDLEDLRRSEWRWRSLPRSSETGQSVVNLTSAFATSEATSEFLPCTPQFKVQHGDYFFQLDENDLPRLNAELQRGNDIVLVHVPQDACEPRSQAVQGIPKEMLQDAMRFSRENYSGTFKKLAE